jgi:hypothetical protein
LLIAPTSWAEMAPLLDEVLDIAVSTAREDGNRSSGMFALVTLAHLYIRRGDFAAAGRNTRSRGKRARCRRRYRREMQGEIDAERSWLARIRPSR